MRHFVRARPCGFLMKLRRIHSLLSTSWYLDALNVTLLLVGAVALYGIATHFVPTGADPGNWLGNRKREARPGRHGGRSHLLARCFQGCSLVCCGYGDLIAGFDIAAIITIAALATAVYVCTRTLGRGYALSAAIVVGVAGNQVEAYAWGGYPQLLATSFGLLATFFLLRYYDSRQSKHLWAGLVFVGRDRGHACVDRGSVGRRLGSQHRLLGLSGTTEGEASHSIAGLAWRARARPVSSSSSHRCGCPRVSFRHSNPESTGRLEISLQDRPGSPSSVGHSDCRCDRSPVQTEMVTGCCGHSRYRAVVGHGRAGLLSVDRRASWSDGCPGRRCSERIRDLCGRVESLKGRQRSDPPSNARVVGISIIGHRRRIAVLLFGSERGRDLLDQR